MRTIAPPRRVKCFAVETIGEYIAKGRNAHRMDVHAVKAAKVCKYMGYDDSYRMTDTVIHFAPEVFWLLKCNGNLKEISINKSDFVWLCNRMDRAMKRAKNWNAKRICGLATPDSAVTDDYIKKMSDGKGERIDEVITNPTTGNHFMLGFNITPKGNQNV